MTAEHFIQFKAFPAEPFQDNAEIIVALLGEYPFTTFETDESGVSAFAEADAITQSELDEAALQITDFCTKACETTLVEKQNWNEAWEKNFFDPITIDGQIHIRAPFHPEGPAVPYTITITPRMSFGTGHHRTTQLMLSNMLKEAESFYNSKVLDMGCGTGVLAVAAEKFGAAEIVGIDNESWAAENAVENALANGCQRFSALHGDASALSSVAPATFDVVLANIHLNVLLNDGATYWQVLKPGGLLFLSGFYLQDLSIITDYYQSLGAEILYHQGMEDWCAVVFRK